jgi:hypothetical protein
LERKPTGGAAHIPIRQSKESGKGKKKIANEELLVIAIKVFFSSSFSLS